ncbi:MAG: P63C domain-containing protein [Chitinophagales bacterium]
MKKVWGKGPIKIWDIELDCYILTDGTAILNKGKMMTAIGRQWKGASRTDLPNFIGAVNLRPFVRPELIEKLKGVEFYDGNRVITGFEDDVLPMVCDVYLEARLAGVLTPSQLPIAQKCEILVRAFSKVGIRALIYEQLGFERLKHPDAFRMLIDSYLSDEIRKWSKEFPDEIFFQMDRIYGNQKTTSQNRPLYYAKFIRKYIYDPIEKGEVLKRLDENTPKDSKGRKKKRLFQSASEDIGLPAIRSQIWQVVGALKISPNKRSFEINFNRMMGGSYQGGLFD